VIVIEETADENQENDERDYRYAFPASEINQRAAPETKTSLRTLTPRAHADSSREIDRIDDEHGA
jgi:hypothetical protein